MKPAKKPTREPHSERGLHPEVKKQIDRYAKKYAKWAQTDAGKEYLARERERPAGESDPRKVLALMKRLDAEMLRRARAHLGEYAAHPAFAAEQFTGAVAEYAKRALDQELALKSVNRTKAEKSEARKMDLRKYLKKLRRQCPLMLENAMLNEAEINLNIPMSTMIRWVKTGSVIVPPRKK